MEKTTQLQLPDSIQINNLVSPVRIQLEDLSAYLSQLVISSDTDLRLVVEATSRLKQHREHLENARTTLVRPLNEHVKFINGTFKDTTDRIDKIERFAKSLIMEYRKKQEEKRLEEEAKLQKVIEQLPDVSPEAQTMVQSIVIPQQKMVKTEGGGKLTYRTNWIWELDDFSLVPEQFLILNVAMISEAVRRGVREISGIRVFQEERPAIG